MKKKSTAKKKARRRSGARGSIDLKERIRETLRVKFPHDTVDISDGYKDNVHIVVVSRKFDALSNYEREELLRDLIDGAGLSSAQKGKISLLMAVSPGEIK